MKRALAALLLGLAVSAIDAVEADPASGACQRALASLQARETELAAAADAGTPPRTPTDRRWQALRAQAARACLGRESAASAPLPRSAQPPVVVPPVVPPAERVQARPPAPLPAPVPAHKPPPTVMSCDPLGCWTSDGARLPQIGRNPLDARVHCSVQGRLVVCQ